MAVVDPTRSAKKTPPISTGLGRVLRSLHMEDRSSPLSLVEPAWDPRYVDVRADRAVRLSMADFDYRKHEVRRVNGAEDSLALTGPITLLTQEGSEVLAGTARQLAGTATDNDYVVSRRLRAVEKLSGFVHDMLRDKTFLVAVSRLVGVPLIPHPVQDAGTQINYYAAPTIATAGPPEVAKWHVDGMNYVFTMLLTDHSGFEGGEYVYFKGHREDFALRPGAGPSEDVAPGDLGIAPFVNVGDTMFTRGSRVYHAVTPVTSGHRTTIAFSLFCPYLAREDANRFWHSAPDDGLLRTLRNWALLKLPGSADSFSRRVSAPAITWHDLSS